MKCARGGLLLEVLVALAIFIAAGLVVLAVMRDASMAIEQARRDRTAIDLAASAAALIEAGAASAEQLDGPVPEWSSGWLSGSAGPAGRESFSDDLPDGSEWRLDVSAEPGPFDGVRRIAVTSVYEPEDGEPLASAELSRLVRRATSDDTTSVGEADELTIEALENAPDEPESSP